MGKEVSFKLKEHDAWRLLALIKVQQDKDDPIWRGYWQQLAAKITDQIGTSYMTAYFNHKVSKVVKD